MVQPGDVFAMPLVGGAWTAFHVVRVDRDNVELVALDWIGKQRPTIAELNNAKPLILDHHSWRGAIEHFRVSTQVPSYMQKVCVLPVPELPVCKSYAAWPSPRHSQAELQHWWNHQIPDEMKRNYKAATPAPIELVLYATLPQQLSQHCTSIELGTKKTPLTDGLQIDWKQLKKLPRLSSLVLYGDRLDVIREINKLPLVSELTWHCAGPHVDLQNADLREFTLSPKKHCVARISPSVVTMTLNDVAKGAKVVVIQPGGQALRIELFRCKAVPTCESNVTELSINACGAIDFAIVAKQFPALTAIEIRGTSNAITNLASVAALTELQSLTIYNCFEINDSELPSLIKAKQLVHVEICGFVKEQASAIKAALKHVPTVVLRGGKSRSWLDANLKNPFRDWIDVKPKAGKTAVAIWNKAVAALPLLAKPKDPNAVLVSFVKAFNKLDDHDGIDTVEREQIWAAFSMLAKSAKIKPKQAQKIFDQRNF
jgi:hypothetical protein